MFIWKSIYWAGDISANQYNFFHALRIKVITRFDWQYICERPFLQKVRHGNDELLKKCSYEGLNFICDNISDACSVDLLIIHEKEKIDIILLLVKQNPLIYMSIPKGTGSTCGMPPEIDFIVFETVSMSI